MKNWLMAAAAFGAAIAVSVPAAADDRKDIEALYAKLAQALKTRNADATLALETPDFTAKGMDGKPMTGKQLAAQMKQENAGVKSVKSVDIKIRDMKITGKTAVVTTSFNYMVEVIDAEGHMGRKGQTHTMGMAGMVKNELAKTTSGWKFKSMEQSPGEMTMDGKPMGQPAHAPAHAPAHK